MKRRNKLILEFTEFNLQRFNSDSVRASTHVDDPSLSLDAFDKHQDGIRQAMSRIGDILHNLKGTSAYSDLRSKLALENQDIQNIKILKIVKPDNLNYDVYLSLIVEGEEYWGKVAGINSLNPTFTSEIFKDYDLHQPKEWVIKIKGLVIKTIKTWLKPDPGMYKLLNNEVICYSVDTGKQLKMDAGIEVELVRSHSDKIIIKYDSDYYNLVGDNFIYFNWWFEKIEE
jgi:hypothetical protein